MKTFVCFTEGHPVLGGKVSYAWKLKGHKVILF